VLSLIDYSKSSFPNGNSLEIVKFVDVFLPDRKKDFLAEDKLCVFVFHNLKMIILIISVSRLKRSIRQKRV